MINGSFQRIGIAREGVSPENPSERKGQTDERVAIAPAEVRRLIDAGCIVSVENGAGVGIGFGREAYEAAGARIEPEGMLYRNKDLVVKLKGPSLDSIEMMTPDTSVLCFAHIDTFPERRKLFAQQKVNVIAMEEVLHHPEQFSTDNLLGKAVAEHVLGRMEVLPRMTEVVVVGCSERTIGAVQSALRLGANVRMVRPDYSLAKLPPSLTEAVVIYDSSTDISMIGELSRTSQPLIAVDLAQFAGCNGTSLVDEYLRLHPLKEFGKRRVEFLNETGVCAARYGFDLLRNVSPLGLSAKDAHIVVLGYGNVATGAIYEAFEQGAKEITILGRAQVSPGVIEDYLLDADIIINGVDLGDQKGQRYLITRKHTANVLQKGAVVIDLVGGSKTERSAIENVLTCTFLNNPHFEEHGVFFSAVWGWPMLGMMKESALRYSEQITELLVGPDRLIDGLTRASPGIKRAVVVSDEVSAPTAAWEVNEAWRSQTF